MDPITLSAVASVLLKAGPTFLRTVGGWFGGGTASTADGVAGIVESINQAVNPEDRQRILEQKLANLPPEQFVQLEALKVQLQQIELDRQKMVLADGQAEHHETQETIRNGDNAVDEYVRRTRPLMARLSLYTHLRHALGEDFARNGDLTVFAPITVNDDTTREIPFLVELANVPFKQQEQALYFICDRLPRRDGIKLDARGNGQYLAEQAAYRYGNEVEQVMLSVPHYRENMPRFKSAFEDNELVVPKHEDVINDLGAIQILRGVPGIDDSRTTGTDGKKRHGDAAIAIFLAFLASKEDCRRYELHRLNKSERPDEREERRQLRTTRGLKNQRGLL